jgi:hypothetical protein
VTLDVDSAAFDIVDALGPDFVCLQPTEEPHFDPTEVAYLIATSVLTVTGQGVLQGIKDLARSATVTLLDGVTRRVKELLGRSIPEAFSAEAGQDELEAHRTSAVQALIAAQQASEDLSREVRDELPATVAAAVRDGLREAGLPNPRAQRVESLVQERISALLRDHEL